MTSIKLAIIILKPLAGGFSLLLDRDIAGLPLLHRWVLTLDRSGMEEIFIFSPELAETDKARIESAIKNDARFTGKLNWFQRDEFQNQNAMERIEKAAGTGGCLLAGGNLATTPQMIQAFTRQADQSGAMERNVIAALGSANKFPDGIYLLPPNQMTLVESLYRGGNLEGPVESVTVSGPFEFWMGVVDEASAQRAEKNLVRQHKQYFTQWMDVRFNSIFAERIAGIAVKTPVTPNQLTLMSIPLGLIAGFLFAQGNYLGGLLGGLVTAGTAIWDCVDGAVARLKFMESDFGETLDTFCDNLINVFIFIGMTLGVARQSGWMTALIPCLLLALGGTLILVLIYFPRGAGKGDFFKGTVMFDVVQVLASRNFIYIILLFAVFGRVDWFLWLAGFGSNVFALALYMTKRKIILTEKF